MEKQEISVRLRKGVFISLMPFCYIQDKVLYVTTKKHKHPNKHLEDIAALLHE